MVWVKWHIPSGPYGRRIGYQPEEGPGWWIYYQNHHNAQIAMGMGNYTMDFKPDAKVPTAQLGSTGRVWEMVPE